MKAELGKICDRLFDATESVRATFESSIGRPVEALSDAELTRAFDYSQETQRIIAAEMQRRIFCARLIPAPKSPAGMPVVARRDDAPIP